MIRLLSVPALLALFLALTPSADARLFGRHRAGGGATGCSSCAPAAAAAPCASSSGCGARGGLFRRHH